MFVYFQQMRACWKLVEQRNYLLLNVHHFDSEVFQLLQYVQTKKSEDSSSLYCIKLYIFLNSILDFFSFFVGGGGFKSTLKSSKLMSILLVSSFNIVSFYYKSFIFFLRFKAICHNSLYRYCKLWKCNSYSILTVHWTLWKEVHVDYRSRGSCWLQINNVWSMIMLIENH